jgi:multidrug resistance efflux pump
VGVAQARLAGAQRALGHVSQLAKAGIVTASEVEAAQAEVQVREAELKAAQAAATNAGPKTQTDRTPRN